MSVAWHLMFWILLPASLYASLKAYADYREAQRYWERIERYANNKGGER